MFGIIGLILGIIGLLTSLAGALWPISNIITIIGLFLAVIGIVASALDMKKSEKHGKATAGLVLGIIAAIISIVMLVACGGAKQTVNNAVNAIQQDFSSEQLANMSEEEQESFAEDLASDLSDAFGIND